jgi:hypothetical protein
MSKHFQLFVRLGWMLLVGLVVPYQAAAQAWQWATPTAGSGYKITNRSATDSQGNTYVLGNFGGIATFGSTQLTASGSQDAFLAKCSPTGQWLWVRAISSAGADYGYSLAIDANNDVFVTGGYGGGGCSGGVFSVTFGSTVLSKVVPAQCNGTPSIGFLAKISSAGQWQWAIGANIIAFLHDVVAGPGGSVYVAGACNYTLTLGSLTSPQMNPNFSEDVFIARFNGTTGQGEWIARAVINGRATGLVVDATGSATVCGRYLKTLSMVVPSIGGTTLPTVLQNNWFAAKVDPAGEWLWATTLPCSGRSSTNNIVLTSAGDTYVSG